MSFRFPWVMGSGSVIPMYLLPFIGGVNTKDYESFSELLRFTLELWQLTASEGFHARPHDILRTQTDTVIQQKDILDRKNDLVHKHQYLNFKTSRSAM